MANLTAYPTNSSPKTTDLILGTKVATPNTDEEPVTTNFTVSSIAGMANISAAYTVYSGYISQTGTAAPTVDILQNNTGVSVTWARSSAGVYTATASSGVFVSGKVLIFANTGGLAPGISVEWERTSNTVMTLKTNGADAKFVKGAIEIRIYS